MHQLPAERCEEGADDQLIVMPRTFIVGRYGMNAEHMPELNGESGDPLVRGLMVASVMPCWDLSLGRNGSSPYDS
jgi:hypothetical protein